MDTPRQLLLITLATAVLAFASSGVSADERRLTLGGFGTIGALYHDDEGLEYRRSINQPSGAQAGKLDLATNSLLGVQANAAWNRELEVVAQALTRLSPDNDWQPRITRAFARYNVNETLSLRAGRVGWEIYPRADSRDIGYSRAGIRPSVEAFGFIPTDAYDGGDLVVTVPVGEGLASMTLYGGAATGKIARADGTINDLSTSKLWGGHVDYAFGAWVVRAGSGIFELGSTPNIDALLTGLRQTGVPQAMDLADAFSSPDRRTLFFVTGAAYDDGPMQSRLFLSRTRAEGVAGRNAVTGLLTAGYKVDTLTPYGTFAFIRSLNDIQGTGLPDSPQFAALNAGAYRVQSLGYNDQRSFSLGLRYDVRPQVALKIQVDRVWMNGTTLVIEDRMPQRGADRMTVFGLAVDFIF